MKTVFVVYQIYSASWSTKDSSKTVDRIFLSKTLAEEYVEAQKKWVKETGFLRGCYYELEAASFDDSL